MEARVNPFFTREIQFPPGAFLGYMLPLLLQSLQYLILSQITANDALCYNIIWFCAFVATGMGTFLLCWFAVRDSACAAREGSSFPDCPHAMRSSNARIRQRPSLRSRSVAPALHTP